MNTTVQNSVKKNNLLCIFCVQLSKIDELAKYGNTGYQVSRTTPNNVVENNVERSTDVKAQVV